ncbi:hypothetical protein HC081234_02860 [Helicobacter cinaedi]|nr:hypothetical protein HC081234_02860 [Helicobacter cinaedi]
MCYLRLSFIESWFPTPINPAQTLPKTQHCSEKCQICYLFMPLYKNEKKVNLIILC